MVAIETKYLGPTNSRGGRVKASAGKGLQGVTVPWDHALGVWANHRAAARAFAEKYSWTGSYIDGATDKGYVWVSRRSLDILKESAAFTVTRNDQP